MTVHAPLEPFLPALALSCSAHGVSVALATRLSDGRFSIENWHESGTAKQSDALLETVDSMLAANRLPARAIRHLFVDVGPGPFTALRMTSAIAQGIMLAVGASCTNVGSTEALAWQAVANQGEGRHTVLVAVDARMSEVYAATVEVDIGSDGGLLRVAETRDCIVAVPDSMWSKAGPGQSTAQDALLHLAGNAWAAYPGLEDTLSPHACQAGWRLRAPSGAAVLRASSVAAVGLYRLNAGLLAEPFDAVRESAPSRPQTRTFPSIGPTPRYVRNKVALDVAEQAAARVRGTLEGTP